MCACGSHAKLRAKIHKKIEICKLFLHIARNQHEIAENKYKEDRKNCYAGSSFQFVRRVTLFQLRRKLRHNLVHACSKSYFSPCVALIPIRYVLLLASIGRLLRQAVFECPEVTILPRYFWRFCKLRDPLMGYLLLHEVICRQL